MSTGGRAPDRRVLARMNAALAHRGPDGARVYIDGPCGLAHRRLAIVDVEHGGQPMFAADGAIAAVCNGEIYNHEALRAELGARGHAFTTRCDVEVIAHAYQDSGDAFPRALRGMFALAVWDRARRRVLLARDPAGQKPLYWARLAGGDLIFASELTALLEHPAIDRRLDPAALALYMSHEYVPAPFAAIAGVRKLERGQLLTWSDGQVDLRTYADDPFAEPRPQRSRAAWIDGLRERLSTAVRRRLMSDVPVGVLLSGGVDSAAVLAMMARHVDPSTIPTFTISFGEPSFDESGPAARVARRFGTRHHVCRMDEARLAELLPAVIDRLDEPLGDPSLVPSTLLARLARGEVKVALGGDGGDELLLGYPTFKADAAARLYRRLPAGLRRAITRGVAALPVRHANFSLDFVLKRFVAGADAPSTPARHLRWLAAVIPGSADDPLAPGLRAAVDPELVDAVLAGPFAACPDPDPRQRLSAMYLASYLCGDILTKIDRAGMAVGLEIRAPFLDADVIAHAVALPPGLKLRGGVQTKYALKQALRGELPAAIRNRKKHGFGMPVARWLRTALAPEAARLLGDRDRLRRGGLLDPEAMTRLLAEHRAGARDHRKILWTALVLELWRERHRVEI
ncbi:MAG: asparagine synthase (glutamine-hydrolyzing) [Myxococcales bacterium]|nr:asparagine synthase (glutamine-hydrolyzing) [Myxococcales bacterium]